MGKPMDTPAQLRRHHHMQHAGRTTTKRNRNGSLCIHRQLLNEAKRDSAQDVRASPMGSEGLLPPLQ